MPRQAHQGPPSRCVAKTIDREDLGNDPALKDNAGRVARIDEIEAVTKHDVIDIAQKFEHYGIEAVVYTDIGRDGMLSGVNIGKAIVAI